MRILPGYDVISIVICLCLHTQAQQSDVCETMKPDSRTRPGPLSSMATTNLNVFLDIRIPLSGYVKSVTFYAVRSGSAYVSFWRQIDNVTIEMSAKEQIYSSQGNLVQVHIPNKTLLVEEGSSVGIHYETQQEGIIDFERADDAIPTPGIPLYTTYEIGLQDNGWPVGHIIDVRYFTPQQKNLALHIEICGDSTKKTKAKAENKEGTNWLPIIVLACVLLCFVATTIVLSIVVHRYRRALAASKLALKMSKETAGGKSNSKTRYERPQNSDVKENRYETIPATRRS